MDATRYGGVFTPEELMREREFEYEDDRRYDRPDETICEYCGRKIRYGQERLLVETTSDVIHRRCWTDYAEENVDELCRELEI